MLAPFSARITVLFLALSSSLILASSSSLSSSSDSTEAGALVINDDEQSDRRLFFLGVSEPAATDPYNDSAFNFLRKFKRTQYSSLAVLEAGSIATGRSQPLLPFQILKDPPSIYINWEIKADMRQELINLINYPTWLEMAPITILEGEAEPRFYLTLNVYAVNGLSGFLAGLRAEWSIYVRKADEPVSYMVVEARHTERSLDSVNGFVGGTDIQHEITGGDAISTMIEFGNNASFQSVIGGLESADKATRVLPAREWVAANDRIYWRNGVADRTYHDGDFSNNPVLSVDLSQVAVEDGTVFAPFIDAQNPVSVLVFERGFDLAISPWYNLDPPPKE